MEELDKIVRQPNTEEHLRERALDELHKREAQQFGSFARYSRHVRFNYATL